MITFLMALTAGAAAQSAPPTEIDYGYAKHCQLHLNATSKLLDRSGVRENQMGRMSKVYFQMMVQKGLAKGMPIEEIKADHLRTAAQLGEKLASLPASEKAVRDQEILSATKECSLRLIADGDSK